MNIIVSGLTGAGKTTISKNISRALNYSYISGSEVRYRFNNTNINKKFDRINHFLDQLKITEEAILKNPKADLQADKYLAELCRNSSGLIFDVWPLAWLGCPNAKKIWLECKIDNRVDRLHTNGKVDQNFFKFRKKIVEKDKRARLFFLEHYNFDIFEDRSPFDLVIDSGYFEKSRGNNYTVQQSIEMITEILIGNCVIWQGYKEKGIDMVEKYQKYYSQGLILKRANQENI